MSGVYLTFNQGVTDPTRREGWAGAEQLLRRNVTELRGRFSGLTDQGFALSDDIDLRTRGDLGESYEVSTIAHKLYDKGRVPSDQQLTEDLRHVLEAYEDYLTNNSLRTKSWVFQANPERYDLASALRNRTEMAWLALQRPTEMNVGDKIYMWESGLNAGIVGRGTIVRRVANEPFPDDEIEFSKDPEKFNGVQLRVRLRIDGEVTPRVAKAALENHPILRQLAIVRAPRMTNYLLSEEEGNALEELVNTSRGVSTSPGSMGQARPDLAAIADSFASALEASHLSFGASHGRVARSFIASLATKRFAILTGLSGSGKTQIAMKFGEWLGQDAWKIVPVRPDWTGSDALFGYEDALQPAADDGRRSWHAPEVLQFIIRALLDRESPYLLILDEMNLAHVERYFADVLSGMETTANCIPNLRKEAAYWGIPSNLPDKAPFPRNLFVVGTVNVDETTYLFSPKVLDRANTFEFRVATEDLASSAQRPQVAKTGDRALTRGLLTIAGDDSWQAKNPAPRQGEFVTYLKLLHRLLTEAGFEFGHRVLYEAIRFAAIYAATGDTDELTALDLQVMQKVLPRLHGSRRRLEPTLCALGQFCHDLAFDPKIGLRDAIARFDQLPATSTAARLPISFEKVSRMIRILRANQFVSFTE
jgi:MoxR-like ATPase